ncbi:MAG TPA: hypothetical protein VLE69_04270 [Candidatus Saccharimonadales bacterium]|nr:hypothetical protein [Candidatus Saccharimonadales bacterium]
MSSIGDILAKKDFQEPPEVGLIKKYVQNKFKSNVSVTVQEKQIIISARSAALAGTLQLHRHELAQVCQTDKKLIFRIVND